MVGRGRREERREERQTFGRGGDAVRYQMRQKLASIGGDLWIEDESGRRAYKVDGKALRLRRTIVLQDAGGADVAKIQERVARVRDTMEVEGPDGGTIATVKKALITPLRERFSVNVAGGADMDVKGNIVEHVYEIESDGTKVAEVSKKWFRVRDTYGVEISPGQNEGLILAVTVCLDQMTTP